jgi:FdhE protein
MTSSFDREKVERTLETIRRRTPAYDELTTRFGPLFIASEELSAELVEKGIAAPAIDTVRFASGVPVLVGNDLEQWRDGFALAAKRLVAPVCEVLRLEQDIVEAMQKAFSDTDMILGLARARMEGDEERFKDTSARHDLPSDMLMFVAETICSSVLRAVADSVGESLSSFGWEQSHCPVCGATPSISQLSPKEVTDLDQLVGGGGRKYLHCSLCGHDWRFKRNACPSCGNDETESREFFHVDNVRYERVEACRKCGRYCLNIDMREYEPHPHLDAVQMGLIHLDLHARSNSLSPLTPTLWNNAE